MLLKSRVLSRKENGNYSILFTLGEMKLSKPAALHSASIPAKAVILCAVPCSRQNQGTLVRKRKEKEKSLTTTVVESVVTKEPNQERLLQRLQ
jgi:hypothetical protein